MIDSNSEKSAAIPTTECGKCNDGKLYTKAGLSDHKKSIHQMELVVRLNNKRLRFRRGSKDGLFPCACGKLLTYSGAKRHPVGCDTCKELAANAQGDELIYVIQENQACEPGKLTNHTAVINTSKSHGNKEPNAIPNRKCDICNDGRLYTTRALWTHRSKEHQIIAITKVNGKKLRFRRNARSNLFQCACGKQVVYSSIKNHATNCMVCHEIAGKAHGDEPVDIAPIDEASEPPLKLDYEPIFNADSVVFDPLEDESSTMYAGLLVSDNSMLGESENTQSDNAKDQQKYTHTYKHILSSDQRSPSLEDIHSGILDDMNEFYYDQQLQVSQRTADVSEQLLIKELHWDLLLDSLNGSDYRDGITNAVNIPSASVSAESWVVRLFVETIFAMEQQEIAERSEALKDLSKYNKRMHDIEMSYLESWQKDGSNASESTCILVAVKMIYALLQLNKYTDHFDFLSPSHELRHAVLDLATLIEGIVENINSSGDDGEQSYDIMNRLDDEEYFTVLLFMIRVMKLLWVAKVGDKESTMSNCPVYCLLFLVCWKEDGLLEHRDLKRTIGCFEYWAYITVDIHLQLQLSAWKKHASMKDQLHVLDGGYCRLITDLWWNVLETSQEGNDEQQHYLEQAAARHRSVEREPITVIQQTRLYVKNKEPGPFSLLQRAKRIVNSYENHAGMWTKYTWDIGSNHTAMTYQGQHIKLEDIKGVLENAILRMQGILDSDILLDFDDMALSTGSMATLKDDAGCDSKGYSLIAANANYLSSIGSQFAEHLDKIWRPVDGGNLHQKQEWMQKVNEFVALLSVCVLISAGPSARIGELCRLRIRNTKHESRSIFIHRDTVALVSPIRNRKAAPSMQGAVTRFLPAAVARCVVRYLALVCPIAKAIAREVYPAGSLRYKQGTRGRQISTDYDDYLFTASGMRMSAGEIESAFESLWSAFAGYSITAHDYRYISYAFAHHNIEKDGHWDSMMQIANSDSGTINEMFGEDDGYDSRSLLQRREIIDSIIREHRGRNNVHTADQPFNRMPESTALIAADQEEACYKVSVGWHKVLDMCGTVNEPPLSKKRKREAETPNDLLTPYEYESDISEEY